jgi:hypothetical protein
MAWLPAIVLGGLPTFFFSTIVAASAVDVRSNVDCPDAADVVGRLEPLLPPSSRDAADRHLATIEEAGPPDAHPTLRVRLLRSDASVIGDRRLPRAGDCRAVAEAVAVVIAAWETEDPATLSAAAETATAVSPGPGPASARPGLQALVGVGAGAGFVGGAAVVGGAEAQIGRDDSHWRLRLAVMREGRRHIELLSGGADWQHTMVSTALLLRGSSAPWFASVDVGPTLGWVTLEGVGFQDNLVTHSLEYGVVGGARTGRSFGRWTLWAEVRGSAWLRGQRALLTNSATAESIPRADVSVSAGTGFLFF